MYFQGSRGHAGQERAWMTSASRSVGRRAAHAKVRRGSCARRYQRAREASCARRRARWGTWRAQRETPCLDWPVPRPATTSVAGRSAPVEAHPSHVRDPRGPVVCRSARSAASHGARMAQMRRPKGHTACTAPVRPSCRPAGPQARCCQARQGSRARRLRCGTATTESPRRASAQAHIPLARARGACHSAYTGLGGPWTGHGASFSTARTMRRARRTKYRRCGAWSHATPPSHAQWSHAAPRPA